MIGYEDWSLAGWRTHLPGVADLQDYVAGLGDETIPALAAAAAEPGAGPGRGYRGRRAGHPRRA